METYQRVVINTEDVMRFTGKSLVTTQRMMSKIRKHYGKAPRSLITVDEYCAYTHINESAVRAIMK